MVITIGREFGSGGKYIGEKLSEELGIKLYDKEILSKVADQIGIDLEVLESIDEKQEQSFWYTYAMGIYSSQESIENLYEVPSNEKLFIEQAKIIEELAEKEDCIIIGRCSNVILKNKPNVLNIFVYASDMNFKINRKMQYGDFKDIYEAEKMIETTDEERAKYYNHYTNKVWGNKDDFDLLIDTSKIGVDNTVKLIKDYINLKK